MCATCGCSSEPTISLPTGFALPQPARRITLETDLLAKNDGLAERNRAWMDARGITALNLMSSPGSGKTTLLERLIGLVGPSRPVGVLEGDQETRRDADRIRRAGAPVVQINTGAGCHLDAEMTLSGLKQLEPEDGALVFIENVGNLVCPALFELGEHARLVILSVTEGEDKPLKYPHMFRTADVVVLNKIDLLRYVPFDEAEFLAHVREINPRAEVIETSALNGDGLRRLLAWIEAVGPARQPAPVKGPAA